MFGEGPGDSLATSAWHQIGQLA